MGRAGRPRIYPTLADKIAAYRERRRKREQEDLKVFHRSRKQDWGTPLDRFREWDLEFHFSLDPCASDYNTKCERFFTEEEDGLMQDWCGESVFMNPPYGPKGGIADWLRKAYESAQAGATVVALIPPRTSTQYWHDWVEGKGRIRGIKGRLRFVGAVDDAPFHSVLMIYRPLPGASQAYCSCGMPHQITCHACQVALCEACYSMGEGFCGQCLTLQATKPCRWREDAQDAPERARRCLGL
jgi:site-specific DNA-methyltransferase (adenine-specific)